MIERERESLVTGTQTAVKRAVGINPHNDVSVHLKLFMSHHAEGVGENNMPCLEQHLPVLVSLANTYDRVRLAPGRMFRPSTDASSHMETLLHDRWYQGAAAVEDSTDRY